MDDIKKLVEEINSMVEDELVDDFDNVEISDAELIEDEPDFEPLANNPTEELGAKTKVSRALDVLSEAVEDFKNDIFTELDLIKDSDFSVLVENLDNLIQDMRNNLLNNSVKKEEEKEEELLDTDDVPDNTSDDEQDETEVDFDTEASLDLFENPEE